MATRMPARLESTSQSLLFLAGQPGTKIGRRLTYDFSEHPVEMGERLKPNFVGNFAHPTIGIE